MTPADLRNHLAAIKDEHVSAVAEFSNFINTRNGTNVSRAVFHMLACQGAILVALEKLASHSHEETT